MIGRGGMIRLRPLPLVPGKRQPWPLQSAEISAELVCPWGHPAFHQERTNRVPRNTSFKGWAHVYSPDKKPRLSSITIVKHKDHTMKFTPLMTPKWTRMWGQRQSSTPISIKVRQPAANCAKDCQTKAHLCCWGYSHQSGTGLLPVHGSSSPRCRFILWRNVMLAGNCGWRHREPFYLTHHEPSLDIEWQKHTCSFLLDTKALRAVKKGIS